MTTRLRLVAVLLLVSCTDPTSGTSDGNVRDALSTVEETGFDFEPVMTMTRVCYAICPSTYAFPEFAVYPDGSLVALVNKRDGGPISVISFELSAADLDKVADLMVIGGTTTGDVHSAGTREGVADGEGVIVETLVDSTRTYVHAPFLDQPDADPARDALFSLRTVFRSYVESETGIELEASWVMIGVLQTDPAGVPQVDPASTPWPMAEGPIGSPPCLVFDATALPRVFEAMTRQEAYESASVLFGDASFRITARPLLPHERGCVPVQAQLNRIFGNDPTLNLGGAG